MIAKNNETMRSFTFSLKELTEEEEIQMQCEARERYEHDKAFLLRQGYYEGLGAGVEQGLELALLEVIGDLGEIPEELHSEIMYQKDPDVLKCWVLCAARAKTMEEFWEAIRTKI